MTNEQTNWLDEEIKAKGTTQNYEQLPTLKLQPNKLTEIEVDFSKPFQKWTDPVNKNIKAIIPIISNSTKMNFWLNTRNPLYGQILEQGKAGKNKFKILQTGSQKDTKYNLVE